MSMYELVFPDLHRPERVGMLVALIGEPTLLIVNLRLRDAWIEKEFAGHSPVIAVYTRNGGGNRMHDHENSGRCTGCAGEAVTDHPSYLADADDSFDSTYRTYRFKIGNPVVDEEIRATMREIASEDRIDMGQVWQDTLAGLS